MDDEAIEFTKAMEGIDTVPGPTSDEQAAPAVPAQSRAGTPAGARR